MMTRCRPWAVGLGARERQSPSLQLLTKCARGDALAGARGREPFHLTILCKGAIALAALVQGNREIQVCLDEAGIIRHRALKPGDGLGGPLSCTRMTPSPLAASASEPSRSTAS